MVDQSSAARFSCYCYLATLMTMIGTIYIGKGLGGSLYCCCGYLLPLISLKAFDALASLTLSNLLNHGSIFSDLS